VTSVAVRPEAADDPAVAKTFISYSRSDVSLVESIIEKLSNRGIECWVDRQKIRAGTAWPRELYTALESCGNVIVFLSPNSARSDSWVPNELAYAIESGTKLVIPVYLSPADVRLGEVDLAVVRLQKIFAHGRRPDAIAEEIATALGQRDAVLMPKMSRLARFFFFGSKRRRLELLRVGREEVLATKLVLPCDKPLRLFPAYSDISNNGSQCRCTIIEGQVGAGKSVFISELVEHKRQVFDLIFLFPPETTRRIFSSGAAATLNIWGAVVLKMIERRRSYGLEASQNKFPAKEFFVLLSKSKILLIFEDMHLVALEFSSITSALNQFFLTCRIPAENLHLLVSSRQEIPKADPWIARHSQTIKLLPLADITAGRADAANLGPTAQEVLWSLCEQAGHDVAALSRNRELFAQALPSPHLKTPLFMALTALVSSPRGGGLPLDRALKLRAAELIDFYVSILIERAPTPALAKIAGSTETIDYADKLRQFLLSLVLEGIRGRRLQTLVGDFAKKTQSERVDIENAIEALVVSGILIRNEIKDEIAFPHDAIEEYLLAWGFVQAKVDDYEGWRGRCRNREDGLAEMLLGLLTTGKDWRRLAYENLQLAVEVLLVERRDDRSGREGPWTTELEDPQLGEIVARWASDGAPFDLKPCTWRTLEGVMQTFGIATWGAQFLTTLRKIGRPSKVGARALLETQVGRSSGLLIVWARAESGRKAIATALVFEESRAGFLELIAQKKSPRLEIIDLLHVWWFVREYNAGDTTFHSDVEGLIRTALSSLTEDDLKAVFDGISVELACFVAHLHAAASIDVRTRIARAYARANLTLLLCPGTYHVQRSQTVTISNPVLIPRGMESVTQSDQELDARNKLVDKIVGKYDLMTWDEILAAREVGASGLMYFPDPNKAVEVFRDDSSQNRINFVRYGSITDQNRPNRGGTLAVVPTVAAAGGAKGYDFFEGVPTTVYARKVLRPKSSILPASKGN
jgi:hypothetical protein